MNIDKIAPIAAVALSLIAVFVSFEYWGLLLILIGFELKKALVIQQ